MRLWINVSEDSDMSPIGTEGMSPEEGLKALLEWRLKGNYCRPVAIIEENGYTLVDEGESKEK